jgi:hypothetical protein
MVVELKTGQKVTAVSNATTATPDMIWQHLQQQYRGLMRPALYGVAKWKSESRK